MGLVQKDAFRTMVISYLGIGLGYLNKGLLFLIILSTEEIGLISLILSIGLLFSEVAGLGNTFTIWKFLPFFKNNKNNHNGFLPFVLLIGLFGIIVCTILMFIFRENIISYYSAKSEQFIAYYYWVLPVGIGYVIFHTLEAYLRGFYKNIIAVVANEILLRLSLTILLLLYALHWITFHHLVLLHSLIYLVPAIVLFVYLKRNNELNLRWSSIKVSKRFRKILIQYSSYNYINSLGGILVSSLDVMMIAAMVGLEATGVYTTVVFLTSAILVPFRSIGRISAPLVAEYWKDKDMVKMKELYTKVSSTGLLIGLSSFVVIWLNIDLLFTFLKPEFGPGIWVFFFLMMGRLLDMFFGINGAIFSTSKKFKYDIVFTLSLIGIVYFLNVWFIPIWGIAGAAISTAIALIVYNVGRIVFVWKIFKIHPFIPNQFIIIGLGILTIFVGMWIGAYFENLWIRLLVTGGITLGLYIFPIYFYNLEPDTKNFITNGMKFLSKKNSNK
jgi:O-antigen/teichoic acid export membrane protein